MHQCSHYKDGKIALFHSSSCLHAVEYSQIHGQMPPLNHITTSLQYLSSNLVPLWCYCGTPFCGLYHNCSSILSPSYFERIILTVASKYRVCILIKSECWVEWSWRAKKKHKVEWRVSVKIFVMHPQAVQACHVSLNAVKTQIKTHDWIICMVKTPFSNVTIIGVHIFWSLIQLGV